MTNDIRQCDGLIAHLALRADPGNLTYAEAVMMEGFVSALSKVGSKTATDLVSAAGILHPVAALAPQPIERRSGRMAVRDLSNVNAPGQRAS